MIMFKCFIFAAIGAFLFGCQDTTGTASVATAISENKHTINREQASSQKTEIYSQIYEEIAFDRYNPDRGFYRDLGNSNLSKPFGHGNTNPRYHNFQKLDENFAMQAVQRSKNCNEFCFGSMNVSQPLRFEWFRINDFYSTPLSKKYLSELNKFFADARRNGYKLIVRWAYSFPNEKDDPQNENYYKNKKISSPNLDIITTHISQLSKVVNENKDVIMSVQAGLLGAWGEWHSDQYGDWKSWNDARAEGLKKWLSLTDDDVIIQIRYPQDYVKRKIKSLPQFNRVGIHHDCPNYAKDNIEFARYGNQIKNAALITGEMCNSKPLTSYSCTSMKRYFEKYQFTALRVGYPDNIFENWFKDGCLTEIRNRLGYRFVINESHFDGNNLTILISNKGFAKIHKSTPVSLVVGNTILSPGYDAAQWSPGEIVELSFDLSELGGKLKDLTSAKLVLKDDVKFMNKSKNVIYLR